MLAKLDPISSYLSLCLLCCFAGCATVSEPSTASHNYPLDPDIPLQAYMQTSTDEAIAEAIRNSGQKPPLGSSTMIPAPPTDCHLCAVETLRQAPAKTKKKQTFQGTQPAQSTGDPQLLEIAANTIRKVKNPQDNQCLPLLKEWKQEFETKAQLTDKKLEELQTALNANYLKLAAMEVELKLSQSEIARLKDQLGYYRKEVTRLEQLMEAQHTADLVILDALSSQLGGLLESAKNGTVQ